jgi:hypothetical protein
MTFRRLYWITEHVKSDGSTQASGVYTSVYDLIERGLPRHRNGLRLTIAKVDSDADPIASYVSPGFGKLEDDLLTYVKTEEITEDQRQSLMRALRALSEPST